MVVRPIDQADITPATGLLAQLGYPMSEAEVTRRLRIVRAALDKPPEVVVQALVVAASRRSQGIGERLMQVAEQFARDSGSETVALYSGVQRTDTHRFYERLGYAKAGTSHLMRRALT